MNLQLQSIDLHNTFIPLSHYCVTFFRNQTSLVKLCVAHHCYQLKKEIDFETVIIPHLAYHDRNNFNIARSINRHTGVSFSIGEDTLADAERIQRTLKTVTSTLLDTQNVHLLEENAIPAVLN